MNKWKVNVNAERMLKVRIHEDENGCIKNKRKKAGER